MATPNKNQPDMFEVLQVATASSQRIDASVAIKMNSLQLVVYYELKAYGPCTDRSLITVLKARHGRTESTWRTRRAELVKKGLVKKQGVSHGQSVWCVVE